ncbi:MAG: hypothetical protein HY738_01705, partial [Bacteroidia bacterium]|nr:hypothetical protein [Bacteroidia bacterium]
KHKKELKENYPYLFSYIVHGEKIKTDDVIISGKPTCKSRPAWWNLGIQNKKDFILLQFRDKRNWTPIIKKQILIGNVVFVGNYKNKSNSHIYNVSLNSAFTILQTELTGRVNLGDGLLTTYGPDLEIIKVLDIQDISQSLDNEFKKVNASFKNQIAKPITEEIGTENPYEVDLKKVEKFRLNIDRLFLKSLGYNDKNEREEILVELYKSILHLIKSRFAKARSLNSIKNHRNKIEFSVYVEQLKQLIADEQLIPKNNFAFLKKIQKLVLKITADTNLQKKVLIYYWTEFFNEQYDEKVIGNKDQGVLF